MTDAVRGVTTDLHVDAGDVAAPEELYLVPLLVEGVVVVGRVLVRVPVEDELAVVHPSNALLLLRHAEVTLLQQFLFIC